MQKKPKQSKPSWFERLLCCGRPSQPVIEGKPTIRRRNTTIKKKARIQLSLIGSPSNFCLCKMTRKNVAIDSYKFKGVLPNQVNRYLSERVKVDTAVFCGEISSIATRNVMYPIFLLDQHPGAPSPLGQVIVGTLSNLNPKMVDCFIYRPPLSLTVALTTLSNEPTLPPISIQLGFLSKSFGRVVILFPPDIILDQLGMVLPSNSQVQVESIVINGACILYVVYIGEWVGVAKEDRVEAVVRELAGVTGQEGSVRAILELMLQTVKVEDVLRILVMAIAEDRENTLNLFLRFVSTNGIVPVAEIERLFKTTNFSTILNTPTISITPTGQFCHLMTFKEQDLLNRGLNQLSHRYEIQSNMEQQFTLYGNNLQ